MFASFRQLGLMVLTLAAGLQGCVVATGTPEPAGTTVNTGTASFVFAWTVAGQPASSGCGAKGLVNVEALILDAAKAKILGKASAACTAGQVTVGNLPAAGGVWLQVDGYTASDPAGSPCWGNDPLNGPFNLIANKIGQPDAPIDLVKLQGTPTGQGNVYVTWTVQGKPAASGCGDFGITNVIVHVKDDKKNELAYIEAPCTAGNATIAKVPAGGARYVQIDAFGPKLPESWGNISLAGPFPVVANQTASAPAAIDLDRRSILSFDWAFATGTCASNGIATVYVQVRDKYNQVVVPMTDAWAAKPCDLSASSSYDARVIDYAHATPTCAIPPNAKGLVVCNAPAGGIGLMLTGTSASSTKPLVGGSMNVLNYQAGTEVDSLTPILLAPCSGANPCQQP
ncbi:MAG: hypothetical protein HY902_12030 [Deltaproteobacteria bacterium]|nr:hypothetical protein [Deltaproteobacteria bacterium]